METKPSVASTKRKITDNEIISQLNKQQYNSPISFITFEGKSTYN